MDIFIQRLILCTIENIIQLSTTPIYTLPFISVGVVGRDIVVILVDIAEFAQIAGPNARPSNVGNLNGSLRQNIG